METITRNTKETQIQAFLQIPTEIVSRAYPYNKKKMDGFYNHHW